MQDPSATESVSTGECASTTPRGWRWSLLAFLVFTLGAAAWQWANGVYGKDFSSHPDEGAHVVTGLLLRDYAVKGLPALAHPKRFADGYYERLPKVALGHYPPLFYLVEGAWLSFFRSPATPFIMQAALAGLWAWLIYRVAREVSGQEIPALLCGFAVLALPEVQSAYGMVMSDLLLAVLCLLSTLAFRRFLVCRSGRAALLFGALAAAAALTKASGVLLALVPPLALLLSGNLPLLWNKRLWLAPLPVCLTAIPWTLATYKITQEGMLHQPISQYFKSAVPFYGWALTSVFGWPLLVLILLAFGVSIVSRLRSQRLSALSSSLWALGLSTLIFYSVTPAGLETRYLLPAVPCLAITLGVFSCAPWRGLAGGKGTMIAATILLVGAVAHRWRHTMPATFGFNEVVAAAAPAILSHTALVSSDAAGEGAIIASMAFALPAGDQGGTKLLRGSKVLATSDWMGRDYSLKYQSPAELLAYLEEEQIRWLFVDDSIPARRSTSHHELAQRTISENAARFRLVKSAPVLRPDGSGEVRLYQFLDSP